MRMRTHGRWWPLLAALTLAACADGATAPNTPAVAPSAKKAADRCTIAVADLGTLGGATSMAYDLNRSGQVVGSSSTAAGATHAFLWDDGEMIDLGTLGGATSVAYAINDRGQVVGESETATGQRHAFLWEDGTMTDLATLHPELQGVATRAEDINRRGEIVGIIGTFGFVIRRDRVTILNDPPWHEILPHAINDRGVVAGETAGGPPDAGFVWTESTGYTLMRIAGGAHASAEDINRHGEVVGWSDLPTIPYPATHAFFRDRDGVVHDLGTLVDPGSSTAIYANSFANALNDFGQVVGMTDTSTPTGVRALAFLWWQGKMTSLGALPGRTTSEAQAIDERGRIVGWSDGAGGARATMWTLRKPHARACWGSR